MGTDYDSPFSIKSPVGKTKEVNKMKTKTSVEYHEEILAILREEGIDASIFWDLNKVQNGMKIRFGMEYNSSAFEAPMLCLRRGGFSAKLVDIEEVIAEVQKQICLAWTRKAWQELKQKGVVK